MKRTIARIAGGLVLLLALPTLAGCDHDDEPAGPATAEQIDAVSGHWFAELPISGETDNWRSEEEGDRTTFDKVTAIFYLGSSILQDGWWGYLYLQADNEMVNYGGIDLNHPENKFSFTMTADGLISPSSTIENTPKVTNMCYDSRKDVITADVTYNGQSFSLTFIRPSDESWERLNEYFDILLESGIVGGYEDQGDHLNTDVTGDEATEPQRAPRR